MIDKMREALDGLDAHMRRARFWANLYQACFIAAFVALAVLASLNIHHGGPWQLTTGAILLGALAFIGVELSYILARAARKRLQGITNIRHELEEIPEVILRDFEAFKAGFTSPAPEPYPVRKSADAYPVPEHTDH